MGIPIEWLAGSPFGDYLVPGLILGLVLGVFPVVIILILSLLNRPWYTLGRPKMGAVGMRHLDRITTG